MNIDELFNFRLVLLRMKLFLNVSSNNCSQTCINHALAYIILRCYYRIVHARVTENEACQLCYVIVQGRWTMRISHLVAKTSTYDVYKLLNIRACAVPLRREDMKIQFSFQLLWGDFCNSTFIIYSNFYHHFRSLPCSLLYHC